MPDLVEQIALDSITEGLPYGELLENMLDNFPESACFMVADRMRRGKLIAGLSERPQSGRVQGGLGPTRFQDGGC